jgi:tetratricopeptide (TPR) repeat protein
MFSSLWPLLDSRKTDSPLGGRLRRLLFRLGPQAAAFARLLDSRKTDSPLGDRLRRLLFRLGPAFALVAISGTAQALPSAQAGQVVQPNPSPSAYTSDNGSTTPLKKPAVVVTPEMRGDIFMAEKKFREAAEMYQEHSKGSAVMLNKTGIAYHQMLQLNLAEKYYRLALRADPKYTEAVNNLGTIYYARKSYRRAINQYKKALRLNPESGSIWSNLAMGYFSRNDEVHAQEAFQMALKLDPEVFEHRSTQGVLLQERSVGERSKFHYYLAHTYAQQGKIELALQYIRKALEEGFKERKKIAEDPAFATMRELPEFKELLASEPRVL